MSVAATVTGIQAVNAAITGVTKAPTTLPSSLNTAMLPAAITIPGPCEWANQSAGWGFQFRRYLVRFYVTPVNQDIPADGGFQDCLTLIEAVGKKYMEDTTFGGVVQTVRLGAGEPPITDGGIRGDMVYGSNVQDTTTYHGFEYQIITKESVTW